jgi:Tol biopolymer transport system component
VVNGAYPRVSPNGSTLAYITGGQIWTLNLDSANISPKKLFHSRGSQGSIRWSPDGSKIAFVSSRGDHNFIGVCDIATQQIKYIDPG